MTRSNLRFDDKRIFSYQTAIWDELPDGRSIGNITKYSTTTSHHQSRVGVRSCDITVNEVPQGTQDLTEWYLQHKEKATSEQTQ
jgi:hypothetical protein